MYITKCYSLRKRNRKKQKIKIWIGGYFIDILATCSSVIQWLILLQIDAIKVVTLLPPKTAPFLPL
jgi:hypothetical protein